MVLMNLFLFFLVLWELSTLSFAALAAKGADIPNNASNTKDKQ